jgi:putative transposase
MASPSPEHGDPRHATRQSPHSSAPDAPYRPAGQVRADLVSRPEDYPWSSYRHNALGTKDPLLREHATYTALGATVAVHRAKYRELFGPGLTDEQVETIRDATQRDWVSGADRFRQQVERALGREATW